jgi:hypothetical protein
MTDRPSFQMGADARLLMQHLSKSSIGQIVTYDEMSRVISRPVSGASTSLRTALKRLLRDSGMVFGVVQGTGFKRLDDAEIVAEGGKATDIIRRRARRAIERQSKADFAKLTREQQGRYTAQVSVLAATAFMTTERQVARIAEASKPDVKEIAVAATLAMFSNTS